MGDKQTTHNSICPIHGIHRIKYCPDAGHEPGKKRGSVDGLLDNFRKKRAENLEAAKAAAAAEGKRVEDPSAAADAVAAGPEVLKAELADADPQ